MTVYALVRILPHCPASPRRVYDEFTTSLRLVYDDFTTSDEFTMSSRRVHDKFTPSSRKWSRFLTAFGGPMRGKIFEHFKNFSPHWSDWYALIRTGTMSLRIDTTSLRLVCARFGNSTNQKSGKCQGTYTFEKKFRK